MPLNSSHMSSSKINNTFAPKLTSPITPKISMPSAGATTNAPTPPAASSMSFAQMQSQSISGGTRTGAAPLQMPAQSSITPESVTAISQGEYEPGTLGSYQSSAISAMKDSGRDINFMASHLNQATAMQMPNWNLSASQASQAREMVGSGRSQSFIANQLGVAQGTPVPGRPG